MSTQTVDEMLATVSPVTRASVVLGMRAYDSIIDDHARDFSWPRSAPHLCKCGREFSRGQRLGQHLAATARQADQVMACEQVRVRMALRRVGAWVNLRNGDDSFSTSIVEGSTHDPVLAVGAATRRLSEFNAQGWIIEGIG